VPLCYVHYDSLCSVSHTTASIKVSLHLHLADTVRLCCIIGVGLLPSSTGPSSTSDSLPSPESSPSPTSMIATACEPLLAPEGGFIMGACGGEQHGDRCFYTYGPSFWPFLPRRTAKSPHTALPIPLTDGCPSHSRSTAEHTHECLQLVCHLPNIPRAYIKCTFNWACVLCSPLAINTCMLLSVKYNPHRLTPADICQSQLQSQPLS